MLRWGIEFAKQKGLKQAVFYFILGRCLQMGICSIIDILKPRATVDKLIFQKLARRCFPAPDVWSIIGGKIISKEKKHAFVVCE